MHAASTAMTYMPPAAKQEEKTLHCTFYFFFMFYESYSQGRHVPAAMICCDLHVSSPGIWYHNLGWVPSFLLRRPFQGGKAC